MRLSARRGFLRHLKERGLAGVQLIISDACLGLVEAACELFPEAQWQRRVVHYADLRIMPTRRREALAGAEHALARSA